MDLNKETLLTRLGEFHMKFSELEFSLLYLCAVISKPDNHIPAHFDFLGYSLDDKRKYITKYINSDLEHLKARWDSINTKISFINNERRHLTHGMGMAAFYNGSMKTMIKQKSTIESKEFSSYNGSMKTMIKQKSTIESKEFSSKDIYRLIDNLNVMLSGNDGLNGAFSFEFTKQRIDLWNRDTVNSKKIIYKVSNEILSEFKG